MEERKKYKAAETITIADAVEKLVKAFEEAVVESKEVTTATYSPIDMIGWMFSIKYFYPLGDIPNHVFALYNSKPGNYLLAKRTCLEDMFIEILSGEGEK